MTEFQPKPFGKYFLIDKLATGGMAEIYKAKTFGVDGFEKLLVIKRILPHCSTDKEFINMLVDEAKLSVLLSHTNIVQVYDLGKVGEDYFISMEFVDGINLRQLMNRAKELGEPIPEDVIVYIVSEICKGLDYAHSRKDPNGNPLNIVHRDISPQNILISYEGEVKIVDFGIAKAALNISQTTAGILKGKISYMSPEQALGKPVDSRTDIFSTGIMLYEILTGEKLFTGDTQLEVLKKIRSTRVSEESFNEKIAADLKRVLAKALAYALKDRFENAGDMQMELTKYLYSTYLIFTPRKLATLVRKLFAPEIEKRQVERKEVVIDPQTRSILLDAERQENLVHRGEVSGPINSENATMLTPTPPFQGQQSTYANYPGYPPMPPSGNLGNKILTTLLILILVVGAGVGTKFLYDYYYGPKTQQGNVGTIVITTNPPGAQVFVDDQDTQLVTPTKLEKVPLYIAQQITLKKVGYMPWSKPITLPSAEPYNLPEVKLVKIPSAILDIVTDPPGAKILLDGKLQPNVTPFKIADLPLNKTYTLRLELDGFRPVEEKLEITKEGVVAVQKKLEAIQYGSIEVNSTPVGAKIFIDEQDTAQVTPAKFDKLEAAKTFVVKVTLPGYQPFVQSIETVAGKPIVLNPTLVKIPDPAYLVVTTNVPASISVNGAPRGGSGQKIELPSGVSLRVMASRAGYIPAYRVVILRAGETQTLYLVLKEVGGSTGGTTGGTTGKTTGGSTGGTTGKTTGGDTGGTTGGTTGKTTGGDTGGSTGGTTGSATGGSTGGTTGGTTGKTTGGSTGGTTGKTTGGDTGGTTGGTTGKTTGGDTGGTTGGTTGGKGSIFVDSDPDGARVSVNGRGVGKTPINVHNANVGQSYTICAELDGKRGCRTVEMSGSKKSVMINLK